MAITFNVSGGGNEERKPGVIGKVFISLFFLAFLAAGLFFEIEVARQSLGTVRTHFWPAVPCVIRESTVVTKTDKSNPHWFVVRYEYERAGALHASTVWRRDYDGHDDYADAHRLAERYKPDTRATCYVNPKNADDAVLQLQSLWSCLVVLFPLIFVAVGAGGIYFTWRRKKKKPDGTGAESISAKASGSKGYWVGVVVAVVFMVIGGGTFVGMLLVPLVNVLQARDWVPTPCTILFADVKVHSGDDGATYSVAVLYEYQFNGASRRSSRYDFFPGSSSGHESKRAVVDRLLRDKRTTCYVNPRDPDDAVLVRGLTGYAWVALFPFAFVIIGAVLLVFMVRQIRKEREALSGLSRSAEPPVTGLPEVRPVEGPVVLKPQYSSVGKLIGVTVFALFWNGIVSVFIWEAIKSWRDGRPEWGLIIVLIPFVLVGLAAIGGIVYYAMAMFNPRPNLVLDTNAVPLGGSVNLRWELGGRPAAMNRFEITLEGGEEATYQRGTTTVTDKAVFLSIPIVATDDPRDMVAGERAVAIPANTMHSFKSANNKIVWTLKVRGYIRLWPDIKDEYAVIVLPARATGEGASR